MPDIRIRGLLKTYQRRRAVEVDDLRIASASRTILQGPSGSGKTTLLRLIAGLERPDRGEIRFVDQVVSDPEYLLPPAERGLGFVFQSPALWPHLRVAQNIDFGIRDLPAAERRARLQASLARIGLESHADHFPAQLSGGQARRVSIARTLVSRPALLLLDEPLIYLDPNWKAEILSWILEIVAETAATLLVVTHDSMEVEGIAGRRLIMESGKILT